MSDFNSTCFVLKALLVFLNKLLALNSSLQMMGNTGRGKRERKRVVGLSSHHIELLLLLISNVYSIYCSNNYPHLCVNSLIVGNKSGGYGTLFLFWCFLLKSRHISAFQKKKNSNTVWFAQTVQFVGRKRDAI